MSKEYEGQDPLGEFWDHFVDSFAIRPFIY